MFTVSVIMPVYNTKEEYLKEAIESILNQSYKDFEFIIVNDCSTNNAEDIILSYKDDRIKYFKQEQNLGVSATVNFAMKQAVGKYIIRMDSDDISMPERIETQVSFLEDNPQYILCGSRIKNSEGIYSLRNKNFEYIKAKLFLRGNCIIQPTVAYNREFFINNNLFYDEKLHYGEDWKLWVETALKGKFVILPEKLVDYRIHDDQANKIYNIRHREFSETQFLHNLELLGFEINENERSNFLDFLTFNYSEDKKTKDVVKIFIEIQKLLKVIKTTKKIKHSYAFLILYKKYGSYVRSVIRERLKLN